MKMNFHKPFFAVILFATLTTCALNAQVYNGNLIIASQAQMNSFNYTEVTGYIIVQGGVGATRLQTSARLQAWKR